MLSVPLHRSLRREGLKISLRHLSTTPPAPSAPKPPRIKTPLYDFHLSHSATIVNFTDYALPVFYKGTPTSGVLNEHLHTRSKAGLFDVSHMGQIKWTGKDRIQFLETLVCSDIGGLALNHGCLSLISNAHGGILDDTVITNAGDYVYMVVNGGCKWKDMDHFKEQLEAHKHLDVQMNYMPDSHALIALQGPKASDAVKSFLPKNFEIEKMPFMTGIGLVFGGIPDCRLTRCGYTGEDGFEISIPADKGEEIAHRLCESEDVHVTGLGARDSLRLEAGLCLYGNDLDIETNLIEAGLVWTMGGKGSRVRKNRAFIGADKILKEDGGLVSQTRKRVGITGMKAPARGHTSIFTNDGLTKIGEITSGTFSPSLKAPIAMGYVEKGYDKVGCEVKVEIRGKMVDVKVGKMPFVGTNYYRVPE